MRTVQDKGLPRDRAFDGTFGFIREGYAFIGNRCDRLNCDAFITRIMLHRVVCMRGLQAATEFYHPDRFTRRGAVPLSTLTLLQDRGSVLTLDGAEHRHRKRLFMSFMDTVGIERGRILLREEWAKAAPGWTGRRVRLHDEMVRLFTAAALRWCGIGLSPSDVARRATEFAAMIHGAGSVGPAQIKGQFLRWRSEIWARKLIRRIRAGDVAVEADSALAGLAAHRDPSGRQLSDRIAAVELLNLLRPSAAVSHFAVFAAHAMHINPHWAQRLRSGDEEALRAFVQEVRRFYPFFPLIGGRVRHEFQWSGHRFRRGDWVLLDIYGTNRHPKIWSRPGDFDPERFMGRDVEANALIAQGGGEFLNGHRCPGEWLTIAWTIEVVRLLAAMHYTVPSQDLRVPLGIVPTLPNSGFQMQVE